MGRFGVFGSGTEKAHECIYMCSPAAMSQMAESSAAKKSTALTSPHTSRLQTSSACLFEDVHEGVRLLIPQKELLTLFSPPTYPLISL